jgi:hypothetical protein
VPHISRKQDARGLLVAVASAPVLVQLASTDMEALPLLHVLLEEPSVRQELLEAGVFAVLMNIIGSAAHTKEARALAGTCLGFCLQSQQAVDVRYIDSVAYLMRSDPAIGTALISTFSSQPVYRAAIVSRGVVPMLVSALNGVLAVEVQRDCILTLANLAYDDEGARAVLAEGALSVLMGLAGGKKNGDEQVRERKNLASLVL